jgi:ATP-dependent DNA helicase RecG
MSADIKKLIAMKESETLERKSPRSSVASIAQAVCGMLNQKGGAILWGINENGDVAGVADAQSKGDELSQEIVRGINPTPLFSVLIEVVGAKEIIAVEIPAGQDKPYSLHRVIWVRIGSRTMRAQADESAELVQRSASGLGRWERDVVPGFALPDCDAEEIRHTREEIADAGHYGVDMPGSNEDLLRKLYLIRNGQLTNAAMVLFASQPRNWAPNLGIRVVHYAEETAASPALYDALFEGPAIKTLKEVIGILQQRTGAYSHLEKGDITRKERSAYPLLSMREGLVNAIVHRDYHAVNGRVLVEIFTHQLVIRNPGKLPPDWTPATLKGPHDSLPANPDMALVFQFRGLMEQLGKGTRKLIAWCREAGAKEPQWTVDSNSVSLTLFQVPQPNVKESDLSKRQVQFLETLQVKQDFSINDYIRVTKVSERQARRDLVFLESRALVERRGKGPATTYQRLASR